MRNSVLMCTAVNTCIVVLQVCIGNKGHRVVYCIYITHIRDIVEAECCVAAICIVEVYGGVFGHHH